MAKDYTINICADTSCATKSMKDVGGAATDVEKKVESGSKATKKAAKGIGAIGVAMGVAFGGILLKALDMIYSLFMKNQAVVDLFATAMTAVEILFAKIWDLVVPLGDFLTKLFTDPKQALIDFGQAIQDYVINYFKQIFEAVGFLGKALVKLFKGDFSGALDDAGNAMLSFGDAILGSEGATQSLIETVADAVVEADKLTQASKNLLKAEGELEKQRAQSLRRLNELKIVRDDITKSYEARIAAALEYDKINDDLAEKEIRLQKQRIANQQANIEATQTTDADLRKLASLTAELDNLEATKAKRQKSNAVAIELLRKKELEDIEKIAEVGREYADEEKEFHINRIENIDERNAAEIAFAESQYARDAQRIADALMLEQEGSEKYFELKEEQAELEGEYNAERLEREAEYQDAKTALAESQAKEGTKIANDAAKKEFAYKKATQDGIANLIQGTFALAREAAGDSAEAQQGIAVAETIWSTSMGIMNAIAMSGPPWVGIAMAAIVGAIGAFNIAKILSTNPESGGGRGGGRGSPSANMPTGMPSNVSQGQNMSQSLQGVIDQAPKAQVVGEEVTTQQAIDRNVVANASF